ncbi:cAMP-binding domain of CRP or a regulatory subunit of cAMP-dependent protein kinases [Chitinophaga sp. YR573]|uniref:response regulator n=1 Tax=Chitinophaga sp. YR573 TaxID=1881040 RepID=UPI0008D40C80|nr:response regulator [Chitinophaga sp. YR573]SEW39516.1 cAMP-binding domain of CRP or a regulatory subunit of cAMP-dependent protein kinases [Chitinophaga sp. YR573]
MPTILLIEDNKDIRENTAEILEMANYKVLTAPDGKIGVQLAEEEHPDLIVCDITMPVLDGYGVIHLLHKKEHLSNIPFIFLTAKAERADMRKGMDVGADDYITKPFDATDLLNAIECRLKKSALLKKDASAGIDGMQVLLSATSGKEALHTLKEERNVNYYKKKQSVYTEGNHPSCLYFIVKGKVKTYRRNNDGKELITAIYKEGDFIGYIPLLENSVYKENADAIEETELAIIPRKDFEELTHSNVQVLQKFVQLLASNVVEKEVQLLNIAYSSLRKKVADALMFITRKYNQANNEKFSIDISRDNLAAIAGVAKESLIRTLGDFRDEKLIAIKDGEIFITDSKRIAGMLN